jgi:DNA polymerase-3 subunit delta'
LLKILEEPPAANVFILLSVESQMLLPTIVSRCCQVRFQPLGDEVVADWLVREGGFSPDQAERVARLAAGSIGKARLFSEEDRAEGLKKVTERLENLGRISMLDFFPMVADWAKSRETVEQDLEFIKLWVRDLIIQRFAGSGGGASQPAPEILFLLYHNVELAVQGLKVNANLQMTLERVCLAIKDLLYGKGDWNSFPKGRQGLPF